MEVIGDLKESDFGGCRLREMLPNQTWVCLPAGSKTNLPILGCGESKCSMYCKAPSKESRQLVFKSFGSGSEYLVQGGK